MKFFLLIIFVDARNYDLNLLIESYSQIEPHLIWETPKIVCTYIFMNFMIFNKISSYL